MAKLTAAQIYGQLRAAGYTMPAAIVQTAIDLAESGGDDRSLGDVGLEDSTWGPSYGYGQVRTLKGQTGTGQNRDINWLAASDANQAKAQYQISHGGQDFTPWTTFTSGKYQQFMGQAQAAAAAYGDGTLQPVASGPFPTLPGPWWLPWNLPSTAGNAAVGNTLSGVRHVTVEGLFVVLGLGLLGVGVAVALRPTIKRTAGEVEHKAGQAAKVAAVL